MLQFDVYRNPSKRSRRFAPYLIVVQSELTMSGTTVIVAPLLARERLAEASRLFPQLAIDGREITLSVSELGAIQRKLLVDLVVNLAADREQIVAALDLLLHGYLRPAP